jgi:enoyl-CoA hydratase/carnithine racemase
MDLLLSGRKVDAQEASRMGLVNRVVPHDELLDVVHAYARELAAQSSPGSMRVIKRQVYEALGSSVSTEHENSVRRMRESFDAPDFAEGVKAFLEQRPPRFQRV